MEKPVPVIDVVVRKNGVFLKFPISYLATRFGKLPDMVKLICDGKEVEARLYTIYRDFVLYRVYAKYVSAVLNSEECAVNA
jgi:hypothetical protein